MTRRGELPPTLTASGARAALALADAHAAFDPGTANPGSLRSGLASLFHDRLRILGVFAIGCMLTLVAAALAPRHYAAEAELLLRLGREYIYKPELGDPNSGGPVAYDLEQTLQAEARILHSRDLRDAVLDKLGDEQVFPDLQESAFKRWWRVTAATARGLASGLTHGAAGAWARWWPDTADGAPRAVGAVNPAAPAPKTVKSTPGASRAATRAASAPVPAEALGAEQREARRAAALGRFDKALDAELLKGSNLMQVSFTHRDPQIAARVLNEVIDAYLQRRSVIFASATRGSAQATYDSRKAQLRVAEANLGAWKRTHRIQAFSAEQTLLLAQRNGIEERRTDTQLALARANGRAASLRDSLGSVTGDVQLSSETQGSDAVEKARSLLLDLKLKERDLSAQFSDDVPAVQDVRADIGRTEAYLREMLANPVRSVRTGRSPARDTVESDLLRTLADQQQARTGSDTLASAQAATNRRLTELAGNEAELNALERERRLAEDNFNAAAKLLRDETTAAQLDRERRSNVSVVQAPRVPVAARSMTGVILLVGVFVSLCAALFTAFLSAMWRDTFLTPEQAEEQLGLPVLASVQRGVA